MTITQESPKEAIEAAIMYGLCKHSEVTHIRHTAREFEMLVRDILDSVFASDTLWAVFEYHELSSRQDAETAKEKRT